MFDHLLRPRESRLAAGLYAQAVAAARRPGYYRELGVADSVDGRFDMVALQVFLLLNRLKHEPAARRLARRVGEAFFSDMDRSLREMGVGDTGVPHRIKKMAQAYFGRLTAYEAGLAAAGDEVLAAALLRNVYRGVAPEANRLALLVAQLRREIAALAATPLEVILGGTLPLADFPAFMVEETP